MGMFNWVKAPNIKCPFCKKIIPSNSGWQSKDCEIENICETVDFFTCFNFYTSCPHCEKWVEFKRERNHEIKVKDFGFKPLLEIPDWHKHK